MSRDVLIELDNSYIRNSFPKHELIEFLKQKSDKFLVCDSCYEEKPLRDFSTRRRAINALEEVMHICNSCQSSRGGKAKNKYAEGAKMTDQARLKELLSYDTATGNFYWRQTRGRVKAGSKAGQNYCVRGRPQIRGKII